MQEQGKDKGFVTYRISGCWSSFTLTAKEFMETYKNDHIETHMLDINRFETVTTPEHVRENELAQLYRSNKYYLRMSGVPFELFLNYLQDNKYMLLLRIVNQYLNIQGNGSIEYSKR